MLWWPAGHDRRPSLVVGIDHEGCDVRPRAGGRGGCWFCGGRELVRERHGWAGERETDGVAAGGLSDEGRGRRGHDFVEAVLVRWGALGGFGEAREGYLGRRWAYGAHPGAGAVLGCERGRVCCRLVRRVCLPPAGVVVTPTERPVIDAWVDSARLLATC